MRLLFDENLSRKLPTRLAELFPESKHVSDFDLLQTEDRRIWEFAKSNGFTIVTTDADFFELAAGHGAPPKVIWLRRWAHPTRDSELLLRTQAIRVAEFIQDPTPSVLVLAKS